jgi:E3 ubiquitin-protein ligase UHRF1
LNKKTGGDAGDKWREGRPIRVCRGEKLAKHSKFAPEEGIRYNEVETSNISKASF